MKPFHRSITLAGAAAIVLAGIAPAQTPAKPDSSGYIAANGLQYWFEMHGKGDPLLLLHGGLGSTGMWGPVLTKLAEQRRVIGIDLQGHGHTALGSRKINLVDIANDLAIVVRQLGLSQIDVMGDSFGGGAAFRLAVQHPSLVRRLVIVSAPYAQSGFFPEMLPQQAAVSGAIAEQMKETPMYKSYAAIAPHPEEFPKLLDAMGEFMRQPYDWSKDVSRITAQTMLVYGDSDMIRPEHIVSFYQLLGGGLKDAGWQREHMSKNRLAILPDLTHYEIFAAPVLATTVLPFLNGVGGAQSWADQVRKPE
jgi:pimeloyl-ACP methyl ester carboxylesterase